MGVSSMLKWFIKCVFRCFKSTSWLFLRCFQGDLWVFQACSNGLLNVFPGGFDGVVANEISGAQKYFEGALRELRLIKIKNKVLV